MLNYAATGDLSRSLLCLDLADIALSAALGAAGPGLGDSIRKHAQESLLTRRDNVYAFIFTVQPVSIGSKKAFNFTVDDLRRKFSEDECDDVKCDDIVMPEKLRFLTLL